MNELEDENDLNNKNQNKNKEDFFKKKDSSMESPFPHQNEELKKLFGNEVPVNEYVISCIIYINILFKIFYFIQIIFVLIKILKEQCF